MAKNIKETYRISTNSVDAINNAMSFIMDRLDKLEGWRGTPEFQADVDMNAHQITEIADGALEDDAVSLSQLDELPQPLGIGEDPTFNNLFITQDLTVGGTVTTVNLTVSGTANFVDAIISGTLKLTALTAERIVSTDADKNLESVDDLKSWIAGTTDQITVTDDADGTVTLSTAVGSSGTFVDNTIVRGDGGAKNIQDSIPTIADDGNLTAPGAHFGDFDGGNYSHFQMGGSDDGDLVFHGTAGLPLGSLFIHEGAAVVGINAVGKGVYVKITGMTPGFTHDVVINNDAFNVNHIGLYTCNWDISGASGGVNKDYEVDIFVNNVEQDQGSGRNVFGTPGSISSTSGHGVFIVENTAHDIELRMKETAGAGAGSDFTIFNINFVIDHKGGEDSADGFHWNLNHWGPNHWGPNHWRISV